MPTSKSSDRSDELSSQNDPPRPSPTTPKRRFKVLTDMDVENLSDPEWTVEGVVPSRSLGLFYGSPGVGKTFVAMDLAFSIATDTDWCGRTVTPGAVVYVIAEGITGLKQRVKAWKHAQGIDRVQRIYFVTEKVQLAEQGEVSRFIGDLKEQIQEPIALVIFDTLARCFVGGEENSAKEMGVLVDSAERIRKELDAAVMLVHHTTKKGQGERGSSALRGATDTMLSLQSGSGDIILRCEKQKDAQAFKPITLRLVRVLDSCIVQPTSADAISSKVRDCLEVLMKISTKGDASCGEWLQASDLTQSTFYRYRNELVCARLVAKCNEKYSVTDKGREAATP